MIQTPVMMQNDGSTLIPIDASSANYETMDYLMMNNLTANAINNYNETQGSEESNDIVSQGLPHQAKKGLKASNVLPFWGNERTMNLNPLLLTNIKNSPYFKVNLYALKTYHEVIDEIWTQVKHMEPWEKGSRRMGGQTGMCGSVRGVGAGGIVSTPFCILYKLYTLRLTRKQVMGLIKHKDSPYIRALGLMYIRYTQPPESLWDWLSPYLEDTEEFDAKAGGGQKMTIGQMCRHLLVKLEWFSTLFPRIPVPIQKDIETKLHEHDQGSWSKNGDNYEDGEVYGDGEEETERYNDNDIKQRNHEDEDDYNYRDKKRQYKSVHRHRSRSRSREDFSRRTHDDSKTRSREFTRDSPPSRGRDRSLDKYRLKSPRRSLDRSGVRSRNRSKDRSRERSRERSRSSDRRKRHRSHRSPSDRKRSRDHKHKHKRRH